MTSLALGAFRLGKADKIDWERASLDSACPPKGSEKTGKKPTARGNRALQAPPCFGKGVPLAVVLTDANVHHSNVFEKLVDAIEPIKHPSRGQPIKRPEKLHADKGTHAKKCCQPLRKRAIKSRIARKGKDSSERLGRYRWVAERTLLA